MRINRYLALCGVASRRAVEPYITQGLVQVNGQTVRELHHSVEEGDEVTVEGRLVAPIAYVYYLYAKPVGMVTSMTDPQNRDCVGDTLRRMDIEPGVVPVGRLDYDSEGLLLLTNHGELAFRMTHPRHEIAKVYQVEIIDDLPEPALKQLRRGVELDEVRTGPAQVEATGRWSGGSILNMTVFEGKNRQIRRMIEAVGGRVHHLQRLSVGPLTLSNLQPGGMRPLTAREIKALLESVGL